MNKEQNVILDTFFLHSKTIEVLKEVLRRMKNVKEKQVMKIAKSLGRK